MMFISDLVENMSNRYTYCAFQFFFYYLPFLKIPTMKINVVCALLFAVGIPLEFKVEIFLS